MLSRRIARVSTIRSARSALVAPARRLPTIQQRTFFPDGINDKKTIDEKYPDYPQLTEAQDPGMNGGYINPPFVKRQHRDPYGDWWDKQERRNFGEPVHEDNDLLGIFSPYDYTWTTPGPGAIMFGTFLVAFFTVIGSVYLTYPDKVTYPREFEDGLERELGGAGAVRARKAGDEDP
ncbi:NADH:ubiquinone oxidoreductase 20.1kD subunit [Plectosphaerella plurivora]|uniref:NADH:ubiquinone oxidoreductase 20.1kD subunit n=1 Tax=Plectosphaerella plurivora TaxID=936078 RepID=A0A9P8V2J1_9PEZI|nr:NADH:ubiquinone oxidoreductase 20.1kD subunit [Plectosphaerella plurivora]